MSVKTTERDLGANRIKKSIKNLKGKVVKIGVNEDQGEYPNGVKIALVGFWNEYGTSRIPQRSFIRSTLEENKRKIEAKRNKLLGQVLEGRVSETKALEQLGWMIKEMIKAKIEKLKDPKNAPSTVKGKPDIGNNPLVHTRLLKNAINYVVE